MNDETRVKRREQFISKINDMGVDNKKMLEMYDAIPYDGKQLYVTIQTLVYIYHQYVLYDSMWRFNCIDLAYHDEMKKLLHEKGIIDASIKSVVISLVNKYLDDMNLSYLENEVLSVYDNMDDVGKTSGKTARVLASSICHYVMKKNDVKFDRRVMFEKFKNVSSVSVYRCIDEISELMKEGTSKSTGLMT